MTNTPKTYEQLCQEAISRLNNELTSFTGADSCEDCPGWDGIAKRCECGNRRVRWELSMCQTYVYAEAD